MSARIASANAWLTSICAISAAHDRRNAAPRIPHPKTKASTTGEACTPSGA